MGKKKMKNKTKAKNKFNKMVKKENKSNEKNEKLKKINSVKYLCCAYCDDGIEDGFMAYKENGEHVESEYFGMLSSFGIDIDKGKIMNWKEKGLYLKLFIKVVDTGTYWFMYKDNKTIFEESGYVPDILGINEPAYGDYINFDTDIHGNILGWKEKNMKQKIIDYLKEKLLSENGED